MRSFLVVTWVSVLVACGEVQKDAPDAGAIDAAPGLPASCADLGASAAEQNVQLHLDGDVTMPYQAHCSADLKTYIPLDGTNTSSYPAGGCATLPESAKMAVTTTWQMIHFDPATHLVDTSDDSFATSLGVTHEESDNGTRQHDYTTVPFASGRSCLNGSAQTVASVDLTGTHFAIASAQVWAADGFSATVDPMVNPQRTKATISATGFPIGASPCALNTDYYTEHGGACLKLDYVP